MSVRHNYWERLKQLAASVYLQWEKDGRPNDFREDVRVLWENILEDQVLKSMKERKNESGNHKY